MFWNADSDCTAIFSGVILGYMDTVCYFYIYKYLEWVY